VLVAAPIGGAQAHAPRGPVARHPPFPLRPAGERVASAIVPPPRPGSRRRNN
jgi:hypothetical protein